MKDNRSNESKNGNSPMNVGSPSVHKFVSPGILLFLDQLLVAAGGWVYWLVISKLATTSEIGHATTVYSLITLVTTITQLGLEYPLLRRSQEERAKLLGSVIAIEMLITAASVPITLFVLANIYQESLQEFSVITIGILFLTSLTFVFRFALLGISDAKNVLIFDVIGNVVKFAAGFLLVGIGFGVLGILISLMLQGLIIVAGTFFVARKSFGFRLSGITLVKEIIADALINLPSKLSRLFILSIGMILLAYYGISSADTGIFYITVMISVATGGFASSLAFMAIPASSQSKTDLSSGSMRLGLSFTAPIIAVLLTSPGTVLSIIGDDYVSASTILQVLAIGILPSAIAANTISRLNHLGRSKMLILIGSIQLLAFFISFFALVPQYGSLGAAYAMTIAFICSSVPSVILSERYTARHIITSIASIAIGVGTGYLIGDVANMHPLITMASSLAASIFIIFKLKNTSIKEVRQMVQVLTKNQPH